MHGRYHAAGRVRREEGLDENGDAPPPYQPKGEVGVHVVGSGGDDRGGPAIPLRAVVRERDGRPPGYSVFSHIA